MKIPLRLTLRHIPESAALEALVRERAAQLDERYPIMRCDVKIDSPHKHAKHGRPYTVSLEITVPGADIAVTDEQDPDPYVAVREAFETAARRIDSFMERRRERRTRAA